MLIKYVRDEENNPVGCIVAREDDSLGWSLCAESDKFNKKIAKAIAFGRWKKVLLSGIKPTADYWRDEILGNKSAYGGKREHPYLSKLITELYEQRERSLKYFKEETY